MTFIHKDNPIGNLTGKTHFMGHAHHGHTITSQLNHHIKHFLNHFRVKRGGRLVKQHGYWVHRQSTGNRHTLLLTTGQFSGIFCRLYRQPNAVEIRHGFFLSFVFFTAQYLDLGDHEIINNGQMRKQFKMLEYHPNTAAQFG